MWIYGYRPQQRNLYKIAGKLASEEQFGETGVHDDFYFSDRHDWTDGFGVSSDSSTAAAEHRRVATGSWTESEFLSRIMQSNSAPSSNIVELNKQLISSKFFGESIFNVAAKINPAIFSFTKKIRSAIFEFPAKIKSAVCSFATKISSAIFGFTARVNSAISSFEAKINSASFSFAAKINSEVTSSYEETVSSGAEVN